MISHDAKVCRRSCHVKSLILAISSAVWNPFFTSFTGSPTLAACRVGEYVGAIGRTFGVERLQCRQHRRIQRDGVGAAALGPRNANDAVQKVHVVPPHGEEAASA